MIDYTKHFMTNTREAVKGWQLAEARDPRDFVFTVETNTGKEDIVISHYSEAKARGLAEKEIERWRKFSGPGFTAKIVKVVERR